LDLLGCEATLFKGMFFVDELYSNDRFRRIYGDGFADGSVCALADGFADKAEGKVRRKRGDLTLCRCQCEVSSRLGMSCVAMRRLSSLGMSCARGDLLQAAQVPWWL
jgi:hypothetical protein